MLGSPLLPAAIAAIAGRIAANGANIDRIDRLADRPVTCIELDVSGADPDALRTALTQESVTQGVDVAVQRGGLHRRVMRLIVMDVHSTLIAGEVIDVAALVGRAEQVAKVTAATMRGEVDFAESLAERVGLLAGLDATDRSGGARAATRARRQDTDRPCAGSATGAGSSAAASPRSPTRWPPSSGSTTPPPTRWRSRAAS